MTNKAPHYDSLIAILENHTESECDSDADYDSDYCATNTQAEDNHDDDDDNSDTVQIRRVSHDDDNDDEIDMLGSFCVWLKVKTHAKAMASLTRTKKRQATPARDPLPLAKLDSHKKADSDEDDDDDNEEEDSTTTATTTTTAATVALNTPKRQRRQRKPRADKSRTVLYYGPVSDVPQDRSAAIIIGGFLQLKEALRFAESWTSKTRGPIGRLLQALRLLRELPHNHMFIECPLLFQVNPVHWYFTVENGDIYITRVMQSPHSQNK